MDRKPDSASQWRIELARELGGYYASQEKIRMIVLGGSPSRGMSDSYSDLDIVVYWDEINVPWLDQVPLRVLKCRRELFRESVKDGAYLESYYFGSLKVDFGHLSMKLWEELAADVLERFDADADNHGTIEGFIGSIPLHGDAVFEEWKNRLSAYPDQLARKVVEKYALFYHRGVLDHQGLDRGDILYFYHGVCRMLENLLGVFAGLNRIYLSPQEPRWTEYELSRMPLCPENAWKRMKSIFEVDRTEGTRILEGLIDDVFDLVAKHMPEVDIKERRHRFNLTVRPTHSRPEITP